MNDQTQDKGKYPLALPNGTVLNGRYITERVLGQGGFGVTYIASDWQTKKQVAIKEYLPDTLATRTGTCYISAYSEKHMEGFLYGKECFLKEAQTLAEFIGNPGIVCVNSYFEENGTAYFVMEYVNGISFDEYIRNHGGRVSWQEAEKILLPVMDALGAVHSKGIIHRDVTPDNIFITADGVVKLLDFGAARYSLGDRSRSLDIVLKHGFAPKEQYTRHGRQGPYTDIYTVAASFYYAITGRKPPDSIDRLDEDDLVPPGTVGIPILAEVEKAILKALEVQPADRYQTMAEFKMALLKTHGQVPREPIPQKPRESIQQTPQAPMPQIPREPAYQAPQAPMPQIPREPIQQAPQAPIPQISREPTSQIPKEPLRVEQPLPNTGNVFCGGCGRRIQMSDVSCPHCRAVFHPPGEETGEKAQKQKKRLFLRK